MNTSHVTNPTMSCPTELKAIIAKVRPMCHDRNRNVRDERIMRRPEVMAWAAVNGSIPYRWL
jgi:hypothetical protein